ncbi:MAG: transglutaminase-like domain-containing protein [Promethearchaeia archaeon]
MRLNKAYFLIVFLLTPTFFTAIIIVELQEKDIKKIDFSLFNSGVSHDEYNQSITYQVEISFTLTHKEIAPQTYIMHIARYMDREPNNPLTPYTPSYQDLELKEYRISGYSTTPTTSHDRFNNTFDNFNATLTTAAGTYEISTYYKYEVKLSEIYFGDISDSDIGDYDTSSNLYKTYCPGPVKYYETNDTDLISASNSIIDSDDNIIEKAEKIYNWVIDYLDYDKNMPAEEKGASWAYDNKRGDCSEFSSLMITLLRIQGIPARKVLGFVLSADPTYRPEVGDKWEYTLTYDGDTQTSKSSFLGHAWVEYYVPNIGWIACDPTWGKEGFNYFNRIDFFHLASTVGEWINFSDNVSFSEFPFIPTPVYLDKPDADKAFDLQISADIEVLDIDYKSSELDFWTLVIIIIIIVACIITIISIIIIIKKRKKNRLEIAANFE